VEKVAVAKDYTQEIDDDNGLIKSFLAPNASGKISEEEPTYYYYADIANGDKPKTVVENNKYVMLNNNATENNHYYNSYITNIRDSQNVIKMSEAIMFTFGAYVYDADSEHVYRNAEDKSSLIQYINLEVYKGGVKMPTTDFTTRQYKVGNEFYHDFVYILEQADVGSDTSYNDGYYTFSVDYRLPGGNMQTQSFSFYLIYESSYTNVYTPEGKDYFYTAKPTLSVYGGALNSDGNNINHYRLGDNKNYPTLIYDYTKYVVGYTYTANGTRSTYDYTYTTEVVAGGLKKYLVCDITSSGERLEPVVYNLTSNNNLAVITFTEVGTYNFTFNYIYTGDNKDAAPDITESLTIDGALLQIHGFEAKYSKDGYDEAQLRYLTLSADEVDNVDLIVPNAHLKDTRPATDALQVIYSTSSSSTARVGNVVAQEDALMNTHLDANLKDFTDALTGAEEWDDTIQGMINDLEYVKTNQNSVWFNTNDALYSEKQGTKNEKKTIIPKNFKIGERKQYNNTVSFVDPGYYLVLIKVKLDYTIESHEQHYYQVCAFQITAKTIVANLTKQTSATEIGSDKFTNENIVVTWEQPATFERQISAQYYVSKNANVSEETLLAGTPHPISSGAVIGEDVANNEFAKYIVEIKSEGEASINHTITIDRQDISNIGLYEVETIASGTSRYNVIRQTEHGYAQVTDLISDSAVTV
ncbi:MAG: hypothetical protein MJ152_03160, partial [Clostridia bacterium]|nr:hypothetical protein [Clostridia bacterium]